MPSLPSPARALQQAYNTWCAVPDMTLCIGALAKIPSPLTSCIVLCFDCKVSNDVWGSEGEYKFHVLSDELVALAAGSAGKAKELALMYKGYLRHVSLSLPHAVRQLSKPLNDFKRQKADSYVKSTLAVSYTEFLAKGKQWFGEEEFDQRIAAIEKHQPKVEMILAGFIEGEPVLYRITRDGAGPLELEQVTNFCMIGSGTYVAEPTLHGRCQDFKTALSQTMYNVYEAKKTGEISPYVGQKTIMHILLPPKRGAKQIQGRHLTPAGEKFLQKLYRKYGPRVMKSWPDLPDGVLEPALFKWPV